MKLSVHFVLFLIVLGVLYVAADDLQVGNNVGAQLAYLENVKLDAIPLKRRTKYVFFSHENNLNIKAISAIDLNKSQAKATVTSGGVGSTFVNIRVKSERGKGINYQVQIFT